MINNMKNIKIKIKTDKTNIHVCKQCRRWTKHRRQDSNNTTNPQCDQAWQWHACAPRPASLCAHTPHRTPHTARRTPAAALWQYGGERRTRVTRDLLPLNGTTSPLCSCRDTKCLWVDDDESVNLVDSGVLPRYTAACVDAGGRGGAGSHHLKVVVKLQIECLNVDESKANL